VARGTQHRKRRPRDDARGGAVAASTPTTAAAPRRKQKKKVPEWQEQLFFSRLRVHAKWVFVLLAISFALGFVVFGVGSGSSGLSQALQGAFNFGSGGGTSIGSLEKKVAKDPKNAQAWRDLATAYGGKGRTADAITALQRLTALKPKDVDALTSLATQYLALYQADQTAAYYAQLNAQAAVPSSTFTPAATTAFGKVFAAPSGLKNPIDTAVQTGVSAGENTAFSKLQTDAQQTVAAYKNLAKLTPKDPGAYYQLGGVAQQVGDSTSAIAAYKKFLKLAPNDYQAPQVKKALKALQGTASASG
jgi:Flp pilus assembly protein TadD